MPSVQFYVQRHGEHNGSLTSKGKQQVRNATLRHLKGLQFHYAFCSEILRARETLSHALDALNQGRLFNRVRIEPGFGYQFADDPRWPHEKLLEQIEQASTTKDVITVDFVLSELCNPPCIRIAGALLMTMHQWAQRLSEKGGESPINVMVGSHGTNVLATLTPKETPWAKNGDIMFYRFRVDDFGQSELECSTYLPAPTE